MDRTSRTGTVAVAVGLLAMLLYSLAPDLAAACFRPPRSPRPELPRDRSELPANMVQWLWRTGHDDAYKVLVTAPNGEESSMPLERTALDPLENPRPVIETLDQFRVSAPLAVGSELRFVRCAHVNRDGEQVEDETLLTYTIGEEAKLPDSLGVIEAKQEIGKLRIADAGRCYVDVEGMSFARVSLDLEPAAQPFEALLRYELRIDDERNWTYDDGEQNETRMGTSSLGPGQDIVYVACHGEIASERQGPLAGGPPGFEKKLTDWLQFLEPGEHRVQMIGKLPDGRTLESNTLLVDLQCSGLGAEPREVASATDDNSDNDATATALNASSGTMTPRCAVSNVGSSELGGLLVLSWLGLFATRSIHRRTRE